jgi:hypothetical protein
MATNDQQGPPPGVDPEEWKQYQQYQEFQKWKGGKAADEAPAAESADAPVEQPAAPAEPAAPAAPEESAAPATPVEQPQAAPPQPQPAPPQPQAAQPQPIIQIVEAPRAKGNGGLKALLSVLSVLLVASLAAGALLFTGIVASPFAGGLGGTAATGTPTPVFLAPAASAGAGAFSDVSLANVPDSAGIAQPTTGPVSEALEPANAIVVSAADPGAYGTSVSGCNRTAFGEGLGDERAALWLSAVNDDPSLVWEGGPVAPGDISKYFAQLSTVALSSDTLVTYHTLDGDSLSAVPAVLQKGTVVLIDRAGQIRMRCVSGNPVTAAPTGILPVYQGEAWPDFDPAIVVAIEPAEELLSSLQVRFPATPVGELLPYNLATCSTATECGTPGPSFENPASPTGDGVPVPDVSDCGPAVSNAAFDVSYRLLNATGRDLTMFFVYSGTCEVEFNAVVRAGASYWWGAFPFNTDGGQFIGAQYVFTDGTSGEIVENVTVESNDQVTVLR